MFKHIDDLRSALSDPTTNKLWGCEKPSQKFSGGVWKEEPYLEIVVDGKLWRFFIHPDLLVSTDMMVRVAELNDNRDQNIPIPFNQVPAIDREILRIYDEALSSCDTLKQGGKK